jgi:hypothetical protein
MDRLILTGVLLSFTGSIAAANIGVADLQPGDLLVTEYLANPAGASDLQAEYFEVLNRTTSTVDLNGLVIRDDGSNSFTVGTLSIGPGAFAVFSNGDGTALGFTPDYIYGGSMSLTNSDDEIVLQRPDSTELHRVTYTDGDFFGEGIAHELQVAMAVSVSAGPSLGSDYVAALSSLLLGNAGSPGLAGQTIIPSVVPLPPAAWLFGTALALLVGRVRRRPAST